jgi:hypothetical protein
MTVWLARPATARTSGQWRAAPYQEISEMKHFLILGGLMMAASLFTPVALMADEHHGEKRYYDRDGRDYHYWNCDEDRQYRAYLVERHRAYVPFVRVNVRHRREYFRYRHEHGFKVEIR